jgi:S1-C subfamily serine protease
LKAAGRDVETRAELRLAMSLVKPGGTIELEFSRDGVRKTASITAIADPDSVAGAAFEIAALPGIKLRAEERTLVIAEVSSAAKKTQLEAGMEILEINGDPAATASAAESALRKGVNKVKVRAADGERTLAVRIE